MPRAQGTISVPAAVRLARGTASIEKFEDHRFVVLTQAQYDALRHPDPNIFYMVAD